MIPVSVNGIARKVHEEWLKAQNRSYSPYNAPWGQLPPAHRAQVSRQVRMTLDEVVTSFPGVTFIDEYAPAGPGDCRWNDPEAVNQYRGEQPRMTTQQGMKRIDE